MSKAKYIDAANVEASARDHLLFFLVIAQEPTLRHRANLTSVFADVVTKRFDWRHAAAYIASWTTENIKNADRHCFIEIAETELMALHEGNFARYPVRPSEFDAWHKVWVAKKQLRPKLK